MNWGTNADPLQVTAVPTFKIVGMVLESDGRQATSLHAMGHPSSGTISAASDVRTAVILVQPTMADSCPVAGLVWL
jgi:hypothetical protein